MVRGSVLNSDEESIENNKLLLTALSFSIPNFRRIFNTVHLVRLRKPYLRIFQSFLYRKNLSAYLVSVRDKSNSTYVFLLYVSVVFVRFVCLFGFKRR